MNILALDTCDARGSVAVLRDSEVLHAIFHNTGEDYSSWLLPAVYKALAAANLTLPDIDLFAVASGPGSFTGLRIGMTSAKAWAELYQRPIAAIPRLQAFAAQASGSASVIAAFADARRGQIFGAMYRRNGGDLTQVGQDEVITPDRFIAQAVEAAGTSPIAWVSLDPSCFATLPAWASQEALGESIQQVSPVLAPLIGQLACKAATNKKLTDALSSDANYVRRSDAEVFWKDRSA